MKTKIVFPLLLMGVLGVFSLVPEKTLSQGYAEFCQQFFGVKAWYRSDTQRFSNFGHLLAYASLFLTLDFCWRLRWWQTVFLSFGVGLFFEAAQFFTPSRQASIYDLGYNGLGILAGLALLGLVPLKPWFFGAGRR